MVDIIAHRGGSLEGPENTCLAIGRAVAAGSQWQEIDVTLSADDEVVVVHDDGLTRTAGLDVEVADTRWAQLCSVDVGQPRPSPEQLAERAVWQVATPAWPSPAPAATLPRLDEVLQIPGSRLMVELKAGRRNAALVAAVARTLARRRPASAGPQRAACGVPDVVLGSFSDELLDLAALALPQVPQLGIAATAAAARSLGTRPLWGLAVATDALAAVRSFWGLRLWTWTVCCAAQAASLVAAGADGLITDAPRALVAAGLGPLRPAAVGRA